jgi:hypothetical protein
MVRQCPDGSFDLRATFEATYFGLREGMTAVAVLFPFILWLGGAWVHDLPLQESMSAYYGTAMRDWFVGVLYAVAICMFLHQGLSDRENRFLNVAGAFAILVAINPAGWLPQWWFLPESLSPHGISASLFFLIIALACWFCKGDSLKLGLIPAADIPRFEAIYTATGVALLIPLAGAVAANIGWFRPPFRTFIFWAEATAIWIFAFYWYRKTGELEDAVRHAGRRASGATTAS